MPSGSLVWRHHPNGGRVAAVALPQCDAVRLIRRGWLKINGERATIESWAMEGWNVALRILFDRPYPFPHP